MQQLAVLCQMCRTASCELSPAAVVPAGGVECC